MRSTRILRYHLAQVAEKVATSLINWNFRFAATLLRSREHLPLSLFVHNSERPISSESLNNLACLNLSLRAD